MRLGFGMPAFNNDEIIIPSFIEKGVKPGGCIRLQCHRLRRSGCPREVGIPLHRDELFELPEVPDVALNDGVDIESGIKVARVWDTSRI